MARRILLVRVDRLGDVLLSTPAFSAVIAASGALEGRAEIDLMVVPRIAPLLRGLPGVREVVEFREGLGAAHWAKVFKEKRYEVAILFQTHRVLAQALWRAGVPRRVGPWSKPHSYLFLNKGLRQRRSEVEKHEAEYNLDLVQRAGFERGDVGDYPPVASLSPRADAMAQSWLETHGIASSPRIAIHPGMGGSALNWPENNYRELVDRLCARGKTVIVSCGPGEQELAQRVKGTSAAFVFDGSDPGSGGLEGLGALYKRCDLVIAPSTGPLHLAVSVGTRVLGFYPPIRVQSAKRWGPFSANAVVLSPKVECPQTFECAGPKCPFYPCMARVSVEEALSRV